MRVRLVKKSAEKINGIDLSGQQVGARLQLDDHSAQVLIAEGWAVPSVKKKQRPIDPTPRTPPSSID